MATIALLPWGDVVEDFLDPLGIGLEGFRDQMTGGWLFGTVEALRRAGVETALIIVSRAVREPTRWRHQPTGAPLIVLPVPRAYRFLRRALADPYGWRIGDSARADGIRGRLAAQPPRQLAPYLCTPLRRLGHELLRLRAEAILCQEYEYQRFDACVALGRLLHVPVVATFQGSKLTRTGLERVIRPLTVRGSRALVIGSAEQADRARRRYGLAGRRIAMIPNPLDLDPWGTARDPGIRAELGLAEDAAVVVWHGRVELHAKGLDLLLDAWARVSQAPGRTRRLLLVGTGKEAEAVRWWIRERGLRDIVWLDEYVLDRRRIAAYLSAADVYAFPSRREGFPVAPIEAMASGLPIVANAASGILDLVPDGEHPHVVVFPPDDACALAAALADLLDDPKRRTELGRRGRSWAAEAFSLDAVGRQLREVLIGNGASTVQR
jgi:glycosyltransferase involved in cell wall biosynthesis